MARHYTVEEATQQLAVVEPVLRDAVRLKGLFDQILEETQGEAVGSKDNLEERLHAVRDDIMDRVQFITGLGIQVKDLEYGLIDFPTVRSGHEVLLCWRLGEPGIGWWHTEDEGFPGRRPL